MIEVTNGASITSKSPRRTGTTLRAVCSDGLQVRLEDGRWYRDWQMGLHGILYGYRPDWWVQAMQEAIEHGPASSLPCRDEHIVAGMLAQFYPDVEAARFLANGSDPCAAAVKIARAYTGRDRVLVYGYHGTCSAYAAPPTPFDPDDNRRGTLEAERLAYVPLEWRGDFGELFTSSGSFDSRTGTVEIYLHNIAAVIVECPPVDGDQAAASEWLQELATTAYNAGALFVLDEVVTGFRYSPSGAAGYYKLHGLVDLYCFGKTLGNGYPVAALAGKKEYMDELVGRKGVGGKVHWSGTWAGEPLGMAAARAMLWQLNDEPPWDYLYEMGHALVGQWNALDLPWKLQGHVTRPVLAGVDDETRGDFERFRRHLFNRGHIIFEHPWYVTMATRKDDIAALIAAAGRWEG
jgi:glutamate-1-semialdehyde 2,1-aminomutase